MVREVRVIGDICVVPLSRGMEAVCDVVDYGKVAGHNWSAQKGNKTFYATTMVRNRLGGRRAIKLPRVLVGVDSPEIKVDHVDGNGLNNHRSNLRICTWHQNRMNCSVNFDSTTGLKGVSWDRRHKKWSASIKVFGKRTFLGYFGVKENAAKAYDTASLKSHGEFGRGNRVLLEGSAAVI